MKMKLLNDHGPRSRSIVSDLLGLDFNIQLATCSTPPIYVLSYTNTNSVHRPKIKCGHPKKMKSPNIFHPIYGLQYNSIIESSIFKVVVPTNRENKITIKSNSSGLFCFFFFEKKHYIDEKYKIIE